MSVIPTYPGVYIEELPSATHTIIGVATSITAFVGYTKRGPVNYATEVLSFGDFERTFGNLDPDCSLTYAVQQFFLNGGGDAFIVRVAAGALPATITLQNGLAAGPGVVDVLDLTAASAGLWGNTLEVTIDQNTVNPVSLFNLTVTEYVASGGSLVAGNSESFRNLTMNSSAPTYAVDTINNNSQLLTAARGAGLPEAPTVLPGAPVAGTSASAPMANSVTIAGTANIVVSVDGQPPTQLTITPGTYTRATLAAEIVNEATNAGLSLTQSIPTGTGATKPIIFTDPTNPVTERSAVHFTPAPTNDYTAKLGLGVAAGGVETDAIAAYHPVPTGTTGADLDTALGGDVTTLNGVARAVTATVTLPAGATAVNVPFMTNTTALASKEDLRSRLQSALQAASLSNPTAAPALGGAVVEIINNKLVVAGGGRPDTQIALTNASTTDTTATLIGFGTGPTPNVAAYSPSISAPLLGQLGGGPGADGTAPAASDIQGDQGDKTGIYALENVDLFNLLVLPDDFSNPDDTLAIMTEAIAYCEQRRAMLIVDLPPAVTQQTTTALTSAQTWIKDPGTPKSPNAAAYFPRALFPDAMQSNRPRLMPTAGAIAGLYARTDASRGVWKAPAGTGANLLGPTSLFVPLTDMENGTINPLGLNAIRSLPIYGIVSWGARTLVGADVMTSQWKYVPVRRTALYIEESLYRGTKWVVFEPNDERLWAAIRLNVTGFMQNLFRQGAFQGTSPTQAYLVKCDSETTTQTDIDSGIVNILVGFAPLEPAEFVIIQITQLAGQDS